MAIPPPMEILMPRALNELTLGDGPEDGFPSLPMMDYSQLTNKHPNSCATLTSYGKSICYNYRGGGARRPRGAKMNAMGSAQCLVLSTQCQRESSVLNLPFNKEKRKEKKPNFLPRKPFLLILAEAAPTQRVFSATNAM